MATPEFILELRRHVGHTPLWIAGVTAVIVREGTVLLGSRSDNGALTPITGIIDPREEPADAAAREALEEAGVVVRVDRLAWTHVIPRVVYENGDQSDYLDITFRCSWVQGEPYPADGEMTDVGWYALDELDGLDRLDDEMRARIAHALADGPAAFEGGR
ncbi:NUDIX domain-containing protein [uncultured Microbacterium sp.]|uniref:NUDIX hydrolase n=1 Tax=uncultured Microbacterium sp. TaxID=191216 RepID=UPI0035C9DAFB